MECLISNVKCIFLFRDVRKKVLSIPGCLVPLGKYKHCVVYLICHWQYTTQTALWTLTDQHTSTTAEGDQEDQEGETSKHNYLNQQGQAVQHCRWKAEGRTMEPEVFIKQQEWTDRGRDGLTLPSLSMYSFLLLMTVVLSKLSDTSQWCVPALPHPTDSSSMDLSGSWCTT